MVVVEIITASGILTLIALIFRQIFARTKNIETRHEKALYQENGQPIYMTEDRCLLAQQDIAGKVDDIKALIIKTDTKREVDKDQMALNQLKIESRLTKIETKIDENGRGGYD